VRASAKRSLASDRPVDACGLVDRDTQPELHPDRQFRGSILGRITRSIATIRAGRDMHEVTWLDRFEPVPDTAWHDVRVAGPR
jgi:hypothetical protein